MKTFYGNYLGVVITGGEKDPEGRGRTQVFIPNIMPALYELWNKQGEDINFDVIGQGLEGEINPEVYKRLQQILPWAECAAPIIGASPSYKPNILGQASEALRNVGRTVVDTAKNAVNAVSEFAFGEGDKAAGSALADFLGKNDRNEKGYCGRGVKSLLINAYGYSGSEIEGADGQNWGPNLEKRGWKKVQITDPSQAPDGAILTYDSDVRRGQPLTTSKRTGAVTGGAKSGHVEIKAGGKYFFGMGGGQSKPGGSVPHNFNGVAYIPPPEIADRLYKNAGIQSSKGGIVLSDKTSSANSMPSPTTSMTPDPGTSGKNEQQLAASLNQQIGGAQQLSLQSAEATAQQSFGSIDGSSARSDFSGGSSGGGGGGLPPGVTKGQLTLALRIAGAESGFGVPGSNVGRETGNLGIQAANAFGWGYYNKTLGVDHKKYFPGATRTAAQGLAFIKDNPSAAGYIDTGIIQANQFNVKQYGLKIDGSSREQVLSLASHISRQAAQDPKLNGLIEGGQFDAIHNYGRKMGNNTVWGGIPGYNLKKEHELSGINSYPKTMEELAKYGGDPEAMLAAWSEKVPSTPSIQEMMGADYKETAYDTGVASNSPTVKNPTSFQGTAGPNTNNQALGMFGYASEGQAVWVFFREGNPLFPVYFAASYGQKEWQNMYGHASPGVGAGITKSNPQADGKFPTSPEAAPTGALPGTEAMYMNTYGGGIRSANTTEDSQVGPGFLFQLYDKNGSHLSFLKDHTEFYSAYDHVSRVMADHQDITEANKEVRVRGDFNTFTEQDLIVTVGNWSKEAIDAADEIQGYINEAMNIKAEAGGGGGGTSSTDVTDKAQANADKAKETATKPNIQNNQLTDEQQKPYKDSLAKKAANLKTASEWKNSSDPELKSVYDSAKRGYDQQLAINKTKGII